MSITRGRGQYPDSGDSYRGGQFRRRGHSRDPRQFRDRDEYLEEQPCGNQLYRDQLQRRTGQNYRTGQNRGRGYNRGGSNRGYGQDVQRATLSTNPLVLPDDPPTGSKGKEIIVKANYLSLKLNDFFEKQIFQYDVIIEPIRFKKILPKVMEKFRLENFGDTCTVFDGAKFLLSPRKFSTEYCGEVILTSDGYNDPITFKVRLQFTKQIDLTVLQNYSRESSFKNLAEAFQVVSIILRGFPLMKHISLGRNFYIRPEKTINLTHDMELLYGLYQAPVLTQRGLMLNVDVIYKAYPIENKKKDDQRKTQYKNLLDLICEICKIKNIPDKLTKEQMNSVLDVIKDKKVSYTIGGKNVNYKVNGFRKSCIQEIIPNENITVEKYFLTKKQHKIKLRNFQLLWVGKQKKEIPILIPVELCQFDITQKSKPVTNSPEIVKQIIKYTKSSTEDRELKIMEMVRTIGNYNASTYLNDFGINVGTMFEAVRGRVLNPPELKYSNIQASVNQGKWDIRGKQFLKPCIIYKWTVINLSSNISNEDICHFIKEVENLGKRLGIKISPSQRVQHLDQHNSSHLNKIFQQLKSYDLLIVILSDKSKYSLVKQEAEVNVGCLTQCLLDETVKQRPIAPKVSNLLQKINAKCNGINHILNARPGCLKRNVIFMGADVTHPPTGSHCIPSYAAVTASHDCDFFNFNMTAQVQMPTQENIIGLEKITLKHLNFFESKTNKRPNHIIFFRDGVSEGQFDTIRRNEVQAVINACNTLKDKPSITFIIVMKRHHTRLFPTNIEDTYDKNHNVPAGTCVDSGITHPKEMNLKDFFLTSHAAIQGVSKPTKYCTIYDTENLSYDDIEEIAYFLCHMYARCTRSVSYPAPTYYAHLAAERAKVLCQNKPIDWTELNENGKIDIAIKNVTPMHFV